MDYHQHQAPVHNICLNNAITNKSSLSYSQLLNIKHTIQDIEYCNIVTSTVYEMLYRTLYTDAKEFIIYEELELNNADEYSAATIEKISHVLSTEPACFIELANSSGSDATFRHEFILFQTTTNEIYRMEAYGFNKQGGFISIIPKEADSICYYKTRLVEWPTWKKDMKLLFTTPPGKQRIEYWNCLFSSRHTGDTNFDIDIIIHH